MTDTALKVVAERPTTSAIAPAAAPPPAAVFTPDSPAEAAPLGQAAKAAFLAELAAHQAAAAPFCIGLFGPAGSGKSSVLGAVLRATTALSGAAAEAGIATPFLADIATARVTVQPGMGPAASILHQVFSALESAHPQLVAEASQAGSDPRAAARDASDRLNEARQRLDTERRKLDDLSDRHARLMDNILFESAGSRVDSYARTNRARIERSLRRFGFEGDSGTSYKELVRDANEPGGSLTRGLGWLRAFWAYRGQTRLLVVAIVFFILAWLLGVLIGDQASLVESIRSSGDKMGSTADWVDANAHWLTPAKQVLVIAGVVALLFNAVRGIRFLQPVVKGASLLRGDIETRRRDLDGLLAHQTHRVDSLAREAESASAWAAETEARLASRAADTSSLRPASMNVGTLAAVRDRDAAQGFFATLSDGMAAQGPDGKRSGAGPTRLVVGLDGFERVSAEEAAVFLDAAHDLLARPGIVTVLAADRAHLSAGLAETDPALATSRLNRMVQVPVVVGLSEESWPGSRDLVRTMLRAGPAPAEDRVAAVPDAGRSAFDTPWLPGEAAVLDALAPLAGHTPRAVKRFVNLYRVARADPDMRGASPQDFAALAIGLALQCVGSPAEALAYGGINAGPMEGEVQAMRQAVGTALGAPLDLERTKRGLAVARGYAA